MKVMSFAGLVTVQTVAGFSPRRPAFAARALFVGFVVDKVLLG
jgi:hypothetical protein